MTKSKRLTKQATHQKGLLVDNSHLEQYGLQHHVDEVMSRLIKHDADYYRHTDKWREGTMFEQALAQASPLSQKGVRGDVAWAVTRTWQPDQKFDELVDYIEKFDKIYAIRIGPMVLTMLAWLTRYRNKLDNCVKCLKEVPADLEKLSGLPDVIKASLRSVTVEDIDRAVNTIEGWKESRSLELLMAAFNVGQNENLSRFRKLPIPRNNSRLLYSFDRAKAHGMASSGKRGHFDDKFYFNQKISMELTLHSRDFMNPQARLVFYALMYYSKFIPAVKLVTSYDPYLKANDNYMRFEVH